MAASPLSNEISRRYGNRKYYSMETPPPPSLSNEISRRYGNRRYLSMATPSLSNEIFRRYHNRITRLQFANMY